MENRRNIIIIISSFIVLVIAISFLVIINFFVDKEPVKKETSTTTTTAVLVDKTFRGYKTTTLSDTDTYSIDIEKYYDFVFTSTASGDINNEYKGKVYNYTINLEDGELIFRESIENENLNGYQETGITYQFRTDNKISSFIVCKSNEPNKYAIIVMDEKNNLYVYDNDEKEKSITKIISSIKKIKTISSVKRAGYYNYSNIPGLKDNGYEIIYEDANNNIRYISNKNPLFYDDAYYRYVGANQGSEFVWVLKDGTMHFTENTTVLNNGNNHIVYRGSFYTYDDMKASEDVYIIGSDRYLYCIKDLDASSLPLLNKVNVNKIKQIGTQVMRDDNNFATSYQRVLIEFENGELFKLDKTLGYELLG